MPDTATQILIYTTAYSGNTRELSIFMDVSVFVYIDERRLSQHLSLIGYPQDAYNTNSDNMWFPVPANKIVNVEFPYGVPGISEVVLRAVGYC